MSERIQGGKKIAGSNFEKKETWDPTRNGTITGKDGKEYPVPAKNPEKGKEPYRGGYYMGVRNVSTKDGPSQIHEFEGKDGKEFQIWGTKALNNALAKVVQEMGFGRYCEVQWNGKKIKKSAQGKPESLLEKTDFFHDYEVIVDENDPGKKLGSVVAMPPAQPVHIEAPFASNVVTSDSFDNPDDLPY